MGQGVTLTQAGWGPRTGLRTGRGSAILILLSDLSRPRLKAAAAIPETSPRAVNTAPHVRVRPNAGLPSRGAQKRCCGQTRDGETSRSRVPEHASHEGPPSGVQKRSCVCLCRTVPLVGSSFLMLLASVIHSMFPYYNSIHFAEEKSREQKGRNE